MNASSDRPQARKPRLAVLTGAGISKESGINTFRDSDGLWEQYPVEQVASIEGWYRDRSLVLDFYNARRSQLATVQPNAAHRILASLEDRFDVTVITQNVDDLHERAGSTHIIHLHGELTKARGEHSGTPVEDIGYAPIRLGDRNSRGEQLRPHIVWFGEAVPMIEPAAEIVRQADLLLVVGTSLAVYPAAGLTAQVRPGTPICLIDPRPMALHHRPYLQIQEPATVGMEIFRSRIAGSWPHFPEK